MVWAARSGFTSPSRDRTIYSCVCPPACPSFFYSTPSSMVPTHPHPHTLFTAFDVLERMRYKYDERNNLQLVNEHGTPLKSDHVIEKARTYRVKRLAK